MHPQNTQDQAPGEALVESLAHALAGHVRTVIDTAAAGLPSSAALRDPSGIANECEQGLVFNLRHGGGLDALAFDIVVRAALAAALPTTTTEWRVESESCEDEFGTDEAAARKWLIRCNTTRGWEPSVLMSRTVTTVSTPWREVTP